MNDDDDDDEEEEEEESPALPKRIVRTVELENLLWCYRERKARRKREGGVSTARSRKVDGVLDFSKNERTNERGEKKKKERRRYLNVQIVARGNDASFGASDFRHRAWSDRDRRRHRQ